MTSGRPAGLPNAILCAILAAHPYRNAIIGDLNERRSEIEAQSGVAAARHWYAREAVRSSMAMMPAVSISPNQAIRLGGFVCIVYAAAVRVPGPISFAAAQSLGITTGASFSILYLIVIALSGGIAATAIAANRRGSVAGSLLFLGIAIAVGALHVATGGNEAGFRAAKVVAFLLAAGAGSIIGIRANAPSLLEVKE